MSETLVISLLLEEEVFLLVKPYNIDIHDSIRYSTAFLGQMVPSFELELNADLTAISSSSQYCTVHDDNAEEHCI